MGLWGVHCFCADGAFQPGVAKQAMYAYNIYFQMLTLVPSGMIGTLWTISVASVEHVSQF